MIRVSAPFVERMQAAAGGPASYEIFAGVSNWPLH